MESREMINNKIELGFYKLKPCDFEKQNALKLLQELPQDIFLDRNGVYCEIVKFDDNFNEFMEIKNNSILEKKAQDIATIRKCAMYFAVLSIISLILGGISLVLFALPSLLK